MNVKTWFTVLTIVALLSFKAHAGVNAVNGNFYITYTDLDVDALQSTRTYNSLSVFHGMFGFGWGSPLASELMIGPSGTPVIFQSGNGATAYFQPLMPDKRYAQAAALASATLKRLLLAELTAEQAQIDDAGRKQLEAKVRKTLLDESERNEIWRRLLKEGKVKALDVPVGTVFRFTCKCSFKFQELTRTKDGYRHVYGATTDTYSPDGQLSSTECAGVQARITRHESGPEKGRIRTLASRDHTVNFTYDADGHVKELLDVKTGKKASYRYEDSNLTEFRHSDGLRYAYEYDRNHNMTKIGYADNSQMTIEYNQSNWVSKLIKPNGEVTWYEYGVLAGDPDLNYYTQIRHATSQLPSATHSYERREYHLARAPSGLNIMKEEMSIADHVRRRFLYDDQGVLKRVTEASQLSKHVESVTDFKFDSAGRVSESKSGGWTRSYTYADAHSTRVTQLYTKYASGYHVSDFKYDTSGRLLEATVAADTVKISYLPGKARTIAAFQFNHRQLQLERDGDRLARIILDGKQSLKISYTAAGKMKVDTVEPALAYTVSSLLSGIQAICAPAQADVRL